MNSTIKIIAMVLIVLIAGFGVNSIISSDRQKKIDAVMAELKTAKTVEELQKAIANAKALPPKIINNNVLLQQAILRAEEDEDWARAIGTWKPQRPAKSY